MHACTQACIPARANTRMRVCMHGRTGALVHGRQVLEDAERQRSEEEQRAAEEAATRRREAQEAKEAEEAEIRSEREKHQRFIEEERQNLQAPSIRCGQTVDANWAIEACPFAKGF